MIEIKSDKAEPIDLAIENAINGTVITVFIPVDRLDHDDVINCIKDAIQQFEEDHVILADRVKQANK